MKHQELEFLTDASVITQQTLSRLLEQIPAQTALHAPISVGAVPTGTPMPGAPQPPTSPMQNLSMNEKQSNGWPQQQQHSSRLPSPNPPPPAYAAPPPSMPPLAHATALYAYAGEDAGDLELQAGDRIAVVEYMNAEWWKGRSARTGQEGIFPRSYVRVEEEKAQHQFGGGAPAASSGYGNMPLEVSGAGSGEGRVPSKGQEAGKFITMQSTARFGGTSPFMKEVFLTHGFSQAKSSARNWAMQLSSALVRRLVATLSIRSSSVLHYQWCSCRLGRGVSCAEVWAFHIVGYRLLDNVA